VLEKQELRESEDGSYTNIETDERKRTEVEEGEGKMRTTRTIARKVIGTRKWK
jgi:hypothetical protein